MRARGVVLGVGLIDSGARCPGPLGDGGTSKRRSAASFRGLEAAASEDKGTRATMEDVHVVSVDARSDKNSTLRWDHTVA